MEVPFAKYSTCATLPSASAAFTVSVLALPAWRIEPTAGAVSETAGAWFVQGSVPALTVKSTREPLGSVA
jgi:hypothetical protein